MRVGSVEFKHDYCIITVSGKTGINRIPLVASCKYLLDWLKRHPDKDNSEAPLWISVSSNSNGICISYAYLKKLLKRLAKKSA